MTFVPVGDEFLFATFHDVEQAVGYRVVRADARFRRSALHRSLTQEGHSWRYYEAYSQIGGSNETTLMGVAQAPASAETDRGGWEKLSFSGREIFIRPRGGRVEVRFLTGATDATGLPIEATITGIDQQSVLDLISSLSFEYEED